MCIRDRVSTQSTGAAVVRMDLSKWDNLSLTDSDNEADESSALEAVRRYRAQGNRIFSSDLAGSKQCYDSALQAVMAVSERTAEVVELEHACLLNLAAVSYQQSDPGRMHQLATRALKLQPSDHRARKLRGMAAMALGDQAQALSDLSAVAEQAPEDTEVQQALQHLRGSAAPAADSEESQLLQQANALFKGGDRAGASKLWVRALGMLERGDDPQSQYKQAVLHSHLWAAGRGTAGAAEALTHLERAYELYKHCAADPTKVLRCCCELAESWCDAGRANEAAPVLQRAAELMGKHPEQQHKFEARVLLADGVMSSMRGEHEAAVECFNKAASSAAQSGNTQQHSLALKGELKARMRGGAHQGSEAVAHTSAAICELVDLATAERGPDTPDDGCWDQLELGSLCVQLQRLQCSRVHFERAASSEHLLLKTAADVGLALCHMSAQEGDAAEPLLRAAVGAYRQRTHAVAEGHALVLLASCTRSAEQVVSMLESAGALFKSSSSHIADAANALQCAATVRLERLHQPVAATKGFEAALSLKITDTDLRGRCLRSLACALAAQDELGRAKAVLEDALAMFPEGSEERAQTERDWGELLKRMAQGGEEQALEDKLEEAPAQAVEQAAVKQEQPKDEDGDAQKTEKSEGGGVAAELQAAKQDLEMLENHLGLLAQEQRNELHRMCNRRPEWMVWAVLGGIVAVILGAMVIVVKRAGKPLNL
eukprot:TRINITY_DN3195_c0_g1_i2.p1 TRINITY_DN3195_c0_g1~~TRINITY_DN3195_c0_g1_i2.p1  ORF type:complete len:716 (-),score=253.79 TRINITY_DN3195_c0_g1_i2:2-2149(-)